MIPKIAQLRARGYISSRSFRGRWVPQRVQNIVIRDYCNACRLQFLLSVAEYGFKDSFSMLLDILSDYDDIDGIVFYSLFQLPEKRSERAQIYDKARRASKTLYFALEDQKIITSNDVARIEKILKVNDHLSLTPTVEALKKAMIN